MLKRATAVAFLAIVACSTSSAVTPDDSTPSSANLKSPVAHDVEALDASPAAIARAGDTVFYTDLASDELRAVTNGGAPKILWKGDGTPKLGDIAVDASGSDVYFVEDGRILRIPASGGRWDVVVDDASFFPADIDLDDRFVYWTLGTPDHAVIRRIAKTGGEAQTIYDGPRGGFGITVSEGFVYFHGPDRARAEDDPTEFLMRVEAKPFGAVTELATLANGAHDIAVANGEVFFAAQKDAAWTIAAVSVTGGQVRTVAALGQSDADQPYSLIASGSWLYWAHSQTFDWSADEPAQRDARVVALSIAGGTPVDIATHLDGAPLLAAGVGADACPAWGGPTALATVDHCR